MNLSRFFIDRPIFAGVVSALILIAGAIAMFNLPVSEYPQVVPPSIVVHAQYPGANATTLAQTVAAPIEEEVNGVENMLYMQSLANADGNLYLTVTFKLGTDPDQALQWVRNRVEQAVPRLPEDVQRLGVTTIKSSPNITLAVHLVSPGGEYDANYLSNYAIRHVRDRLARIDGVGQVNLWGPGAYAMRIWLDPEAVAARGLTAAEVVAAIREQNAQAAVGSIGMAPMIESAPFQLSVTADGRLRSVEEFGDIILHAEHDGRTTRLRDVARIELAAQEYGVRAYLGKGAAVPLAIMEAPGANALDIAARVQATMEELKAQFPAGLDYRIVYNPTRSVQASIDAVVKTLFEAIVLVVIVVFLFLQTWRASIIPLLAVPVSIVGTMACLYLFGFSINALSLFGLVLAIGIVVDDAIVVVENVERNIELGHSPREATYLAMREVSGPIIAIALTLVAVFVPLAFLSGLTGRFYQQFAVTIAVSTVLSAINSLTLSPALSALLLKPHGAQTDWLSRAMHRAFGSFFKRFNRTFNRGSERYGQGVARLAGRKSLVMVIYAALLGVTVFLGNVVPGGFVPAQDKEYLISFVQLPAGSTLNRTDAVLEKMTEIALVEPGVASTSSYAGLSINGTTTSSSSGLSFILLKPFEERKGLSADDIASSLNAKYAGLEKASFAAVFPAPPVMGIGSLGGFKLQLEDQGNLGYDALYKATQDFIAEAARQPELTPLFTTYQINVPQLRIEVDRPKAKQLGISVREVFQTLQIYLGSFYVNDFNLLGRVYQVRVQADAPHRAHPEDILQLKTRAADGQMVPFSAFASVEQIYGPELVTRYNGFTAADLSGAPAPGYSSSQAMAAIERVAAKTLPPGIGYEWTDLTYQQIIAGNSALWIFPLCVLLVLLVLAAQYESLTLPLSVILIVPMSVFSALLGVWLTAGDNNIFTQIGLIVLVGLASKNAILIVEFARELEIAGRSTLDAVLEACRLRLRPILMTSLAFIMGVVPLVVSQGAGAEMRQAMGISVFFGMLGVTFFGLFLTPVFYMVMRSSSGRPLRSIRSWSDGAQAH
ncbi:efflux RND transporter permease subunit [Pseudomonas guariconensis]|uniref:efflux RND transporter permease subunit n=1 Tax=Pseudomonas TaxID=286 RepID=UPI0020970E8A|nr:MULTISPECIES: multidrug efflux RND transporter permease subunit [Pseudomonas]MCO7641151.1 efflux RND transporter permease subunit [Pseudomonas sp. S 311-6]MCO7515433.1 efflux RND transporter permease subunit [Pseudomonas putida]MCO7566492.1 efflux RND transporter permease subunit [Pseudomonas mosselii]MCO7605448.1 efflux RND transporter permease subunit [Pseudomonas guariconensis]MCO7617841.1 efflux RND transporter permease subunit [Pseudomonas guariconensis]